MSESINAIIFPCPDFKISELNPFRENIIHIPTKNENEKIPCLFQKKENSDKILIIFHCNGLDMFDVFKFINELFADKNINILIPEYPGYSIYYSPLSSKKCLENSLIIYDYILNNIKNIKEENIYILGRSLGTGPAIYLASQRNPAGTFLISPYRTFGDVGRRIYDKGKIDALSQHFRSIDYIDKIKTPLLIIHGKNDELINFEEAKILYEKCSNNIIKEFKLIDNMMHSYKLSFLSEIIVPYIIDFANKNCNLKNFKNENKEENKIIIDFDEIIYKLPEKLESLIRIEEDEKLLEEREGNLNEEDLYGE